MILLSNKRHMASTKNLKELHAFAKRLGLEKELFVPAGNNVPISFYYVKKRKTRKEAIKLGAKLVRGEEFLLQIIAAEKLQNRNR